MTATTALFWGLIGSASAITVFEVSQGLGLSRLNLPLLFGSYFTDRRTWANVWGLGLYLCGGWVFALVYLWVFAELGITTPAGAAALGLFHGLFLLTVVMPVLPYVHPRIATEYDSPTSARRLEPPGFAGLNYGAGTPLTALVAHTLFGLVIGIGYLHS